MKNNRDFLTKTTIIVTATATIISAVLKMTHHQGADIFLFIALIGFIFMTRMKFLKKPHRTK